MTKGTFLVADNLSCSNVLNHLILYHWASALYRCHFVCDLSKGEQHSINHYEHRHHNMQYSNTSQKGLLR